MLYLPVWKTGTVWNVCQRLRVFCSVFVSSDSDSSQDQLSVLASCTFIPHILSLWNLGAYWNLPSIKKWDLMKDEVLPGFIWRSAQPPERSRWKAPNLLFHLKQQPFQTTHSMQSYQIQGCFLLLRLTDEGVLNFVPRTLSWLFLDTLLGGLTVPLFIITLRM